MNKYKKNEHSIYLWLKLIILISICTFSFWVGNVGGKQTTFEYIQDNCEIHSHSIICKINKQQVP